ncbi:MAG: hypothetical protein MJA27_23930 [Pseudanabaenales cyanobacterium]|nr:hypothetical protein [Pseudanabaenales cyanobacterium]
MLNGEVQWHETILQQGPTPKKRTKTAKFDNTPEGFEKLSQWLKSQEIEKVHGALEATNIYGQALAIYL